MSSEVRVVRHREFDPSKIQISQPILNPKNGVYHCQMYYEERPFFLETPYVKAPFGMTSYQKGSTGKVERSITMMASGNYTDSQETIQNFFSKLREIDQKVLAYGYKHRGTIFGTEITIDSMEDVLERFDSGVRGKIDANGVPYPDKISPRVASTTGGSRPDVYLFKNSKTPIDIPTWEDLDAFVLRGKSLKGIIEPKIFIMRNQKIGLIYEYHQIKLPSVILQKTPKRAISAFSEDDSS